MIPLFYPAIPDLQSVHWGLLAILMIFASDFAAGQKWSRFIRSKSFDVGAVLSCCLGHRSSSFAIRPNCSLDASALPPRARFVGGERIIKH
jgi:hypothetical protein